MGLTHLQLSVKPVDSYYPIELLNKALWQANVGF